MKCPNCGFELSSVQSVCPNCGINLKNDDINWSDYKELPLGTVMEHFSDLQDEDSKDSKEKAASKHADKNQTDDTKKQDHSDQKENESDNPVLAEYIKSHKDETTAGEKRSSRKGNSFSDKEKSSAQEKKTVKGRSRKREKKDRKKNYILTAAALLVIAVGGITYYQHAQKVEAAKEEQIENRQKLAAIDEKLDSYYTDESHNFIYNDVTQEDITNTTKNLDNYSSEKQYKKIAAKKKDLTYKADKTKELNSYFNAAVLVDGKLQEDVHAKTDQKMAMDSLEADDDFARLVNQAIEQANNENQAVDKADKEVKTLLASYKKGELADSVSRKDVEKAQKTVDQLYDSDEKKSLLKDLKTVSQALVAREKAEEKEKAEKAAAKKATEDSQDKKAAKNSGSLASAKTNSSNQPIISADQNDVADSNNDAWNWNSGVYDKVINECISRGYIVSGGYYVEKAQIIDGEGYYNLYATNNKSKILKGIGKSAFPMYIVTINAKTGEFRGNGGN